MQPSTEQNVDRIQLGDKTIILVGTAHVSAASVELAERTIRETKPDSVAVELCESRYHALRDPNRWKNTDIVQVIKSGRTFLLLAQLILASFQRKLGKELNIKPGEEMLRAVAVAEELHANLVLADRDVKTTLKRTWAALTPGQRAKLIVQFPMKTFTDEKISQEEIEKLKAADALEAAMTELSEAFPGVRKALIDERDRYLAAKIAAAPGKTIVAIIGAGHVPGIKRYLGETIDLAELEVIPPGKRLGKFIAWIIPLAVISLVVYSLQNAGSGAGIAIAKSWILITGFSAALGALLALSHPLTILTAFISGPITTLFPILRSGWFAGLVEAMLRKPKVSDLEAILDDMTSVRGVWQNRLSRILLVVLLTNVLGAVGSVIAIGKVAAMSHVLPQ